MYSAWELWGLVAVMGAPQIPGTTVIAIDPLPEKQALARKCGAHFAGSPGQAGELVAAHAGDGVDVAIEAVGSAKVMEACLDLLTRGGALVSVGLPHPDQMLNVQALPFAGTGKRLIGSYRGDADPARDIPAYIQLWRDGRLPVELLHTDTKPLSEINQGLDDLAEGLVVRRLFTF